MAVSSKISFLFFLVTLFTSHHIHARESQFFNKIPSNTNNLPVENQPKQVDPLNKPEEQEPNFIPENENGGYGLYGHESGQLPPTTTTNPTNTNTNLPYNNEPNNFLPKNYNSESYVTESEGYKPAYEKQSYPATTSAAVNGQYYDENSYNGKQQSVNDFKLGESSYKSNVGNNYNSESYVTESEGYKPAYEKQSYPSTTTTTTSDAVNGQYYDENFYNEKQQSVNDYKLGQSSYKTNVGNNYNYKSNGANINPVEKQGTSDTRFMENGKYFYDINLEKNNNRYPFQNTQGFGEQYSKNNGGYYGNGYENFNSFSNDEFQNQGEQFQDFQHQKGLP